MTDGTPVDGPTRRLPTWQEFLAAQTGWPFLIKWVVVGAAPSLIFNSVTVAFWSPGKSWNTPFVIVGGVFAAFAAVHGWLLFGRSWKILPWAGTGLLLNWGWGPAFRTPLAAFVLPLIQVALLLGVRARPWLWIAAVIAAVVSSLLFPWVAHSIARPVISSLGQSTTWLGSMYFFLGAQQGSVIFQLFIKGATLAWLMPPVRSTSNHSSKP